MKNLRTIVFLLVGAIFLNSCNSQVDSEVEPLEPIIVSSKVATSSDASGRASYQYLEIKLDPSGLTTDLILLKGKPLFDNGEGNDIAAGDYIYSSVDPVSFPNGNPGGRQDATEWYVKCAIDASFAGGQCGGETCPDETLWGNSTWFCICFSDCKGGIGSDC